MESIKAKELKRAASKKQEKYQGMWDFAQGAAEKVWDMSDSMDSWLNTHTVTKDDTKAIIWKSYNFYMDANKHSNNKKKMVIKLCTQ